MINPSSSYSFKFSQTAIDIGQILTDAPEDAVVCVIKIHGKITIFCNIDKLTPAYKHAGLKDYSPNYTEGFTLWTVYENGCIKGKTDPATSTQTPSPIKWQIARDTLTTILSIWVPWKQAEAKSKSRVTVDFYT